MRNLNKSARWIMLAVLVSLALSLVAEASIDLDVTHIARLPRDTYFYSVNYPDGVPIVRPGTENQKRYPAYGETVTFEAHFINKGNTDCGPVNYRWKVNGEVIGTGSIAGVAAGQENTASINWQWNIDGIDTDHTDQTVTFELDYDNQVIESYEQNNTLTDFLEACSLAIYVEPHIYAAFNQTKNLAGTYSFEDWIQRQIKAMNDNFARSIYPLAPRGCLERVRIDKIQVSSPPPNDGLADGRWQFTGDVSYVSWAATKVDNGLIHELMHQLGIIDLYNMPVLAGGNQVITPDGLPNGYTFGFGRPGIMSGGDIAPHSSGQTDTMPQYCSSHDVIALNKNCGYRRGFYGEYQYDIPAENYILVKDSSGNPAPGVNIKVYQSQYGDLIGTPVITGTTDANGKFILTNRPVNRTTTTPTGHTLRPNPFGTIDVVGGRSTLLVEMSRSGGDFDYAWMNIIDFNMAYWEGNTESWTYTINSRLGASSLPRITGLKGAVESSKVVLTWPAVERAVSYRVYRASPYLNRPDDPNHEYENWVFKLLTTTKQTSYTDFSRFETSRYAVTAVDAQGKESPLSNRVFAPNLINPAAVAVLPDNTRIILDPQNGYAYMRQTSDGIYIGNTGSVHNHVEYSKFMTVDNRLNRMLTSHPGDWYNGPHSIRVTDVYGNTDGMWDIGTKGSGPGQFNNPTGVAVDNESRIYAADSGNNRIQVFDSKGNFLTAFGSSGSNPGQFSNPQGVAVDSDHRIYVCDKNNKRVQILQFDPASNTVSYTGMLTGKALQGPTGIAIALSGRIYVTDSPANRVEEFSASGKWLRSYTSASGGYTGTLSNPTGIAVDSTGQVIVCDTNKKRIVTIDVVSSVDVSDARKMFDNHPVQMEGRIVTASFGNSFYVQDLNRLPGIRVVSDSPVTIGQKVDIYGIMATNGGEREIIASIVDPRGMSQIRPQPHAMALRNLGGEPDGPVPGTSGGAGLNNIGLLVRVFGKVSDSSSSTSEFMLYDGSPDKVKVRAIDLDIPADGTYALVTGISGADNSSGENLPLLRAIAIN